MDSSDRDAILQGLHGDNPQYPSEVERAISDCFPSDDPLDGTDFDPVDYINAKFPDESSMATMPAFMAQQQTRIGQLDQEIYESIRSQSIQADRAQEDVDSAKQAIKQLFLKVQDITGKAEQSEVMVQEICRDIKQLDYAKRHLTSTITGLKRLHMFTMAVSKLEHMTEQRQYPQVANLVKAVNQLSRYFEHYTSVPEIQELRATVNQIKDGLTKQIFEDFESIEDVSADYAQDGDDAALFYQSDERTPESLAGACSVADALGPDCRRTLCRTLCSTWLKPYERDFAQGEQYSALEYADRRYAWVRRLLNSNRDKYAAVFPDDWGLDYQIVTMFCQRTASQLKRVLAEYVPPESADVASLIRSLKKTLQFEQEMSLKYEKHRLQDKQSASTNNASDAADTGKKDSESAPLINEKGEEVDPMSVEGIKLRRAKGKMKGAASTGEAKPNHPQTKGIIDSQDDEELRLAEIQAELNELPIIKGCISEVFEPYLIAYVLRESEEITKSLETAAKEEDLSPDGTLTVFTSSALLLRRIRQAMKNCTLLSTGVTFYQMHEEFKKCFAQYSKTLDGKVVAAKKTSFTASEEALQDAVGAMCFALTSAEYIANEIPKLEAAVKQRIDREFVDKIDMTGETDLFYQNTGNAIRALVDGLNHRFSRSMSRMVKTNWVTFDAVGDESSYVTEFNTAVNEYVPTVRKLLEELFFQKFCGDFAMSALNEYLNKLIHCKRIGEVGAQQLLIDAHSIKTILIGLPTVGQSSSEGQEEAAFGVEAYTKYITEFMQLVELLLKLVGMNAPTDHVIRNFTILLENGTMDDLKMILGLRGVKKNEMSEIVKKASELGVPKQGKRVFNVSMGAAELSSSISHQFNEKAKEAATNLNFNVNLPSSKNKMDLLNAMSSVFESTSSSLKSYTKSSGYGKR